MTRFKRSGLNWELRPWTLSLAGFSLVAEIEAWQPQPRPLDGTVASQTHDANNPSSDHRPKPYDGPGIVRAVDVGEFDPEGNILVDALVESRDPRLRYIIHEGQIWRAYDHAVGPAWTPHPYTGPNDHPSHVHISLDWNHDADGSPWNLQLGGAMPLLPLKLGDGYKTPQPDKGIIEVRPEKQEDVEMFQDMLDRAYGTSLTRDGKYGPAVVEVVKEYVGGDGTNVGGGLFENVMWHFARAAARSVMVPPTVQTIEVVKGITFE